MINCVKLHGRKQLKYYIRFEDKYGVADVFLMKHNQLSGNVNERVVFSEGTDQFLGRTGLTSLSVYSLRMDELSDLEEFKPDKVICIGDIDGNNGIDIIDIKDVETLCSKFELRVKDIVPECKVEYVTTVYAAETLLLYKYVQRFDGLLNLESIVFREYTIRAHEMLAAIMSGVTSYRDIKKFRQLVTPEDIICGLELVNGTPNADFITMLSTTCGTTKEELIARLEDVVSRYTSLKHSGIKFQVDGIEIDTNAIKITGKTTFKEFKRILGL